jgi:hypothetical protein
MPAIPHDSRVDVEALIVDRYLDALLAGAGEPGAASRDHNNTVDPIIREAADVLRRSLVRVHPSFHFEERLAARLSATASGHADASRPGAVVPFHPLRRGSLDDGNPGASPIADALAAAPREMTGARRSPAVRPLLIGGAITSAALSLAGVAWVARRAVRPTLAELEGML